MGRGCVQWLLRSFADFFCSLPTLGFTPLQLRRGKNKHLQLFQWKAAWNLVLTIIFLGTPVMYQDISEPDCYLNIHFVSPICLICRKLNSITFSFICNACIDSFCRKALRSPIYYRQSVVTRKIELHGVQIIFERDFVRVRRPMPM